ncbi:27207_t:CDS:2, partial [Racocetra persica]
NATKKLAHDLFHNHKLASNKEIKEQLKKILENNDEYKKNLQKLNEKSVSFNKFWSDKLYSEDTVLQKGPASSSASSPTISEAAIQENYDELSSGDNNENDY